MFVKYIYIYKYWDIIFLNVNSGWKVKDELKMILGYM